MGTSDMEVTALLKVEKGRPVKGQESHFLLFQVPYQSRNYLAEVVVSQGLQGKRIRVLDVRVEGATRQSPKTSKAFIEVSNRARSAALLYGLPQGVPGVLLTKKPLKDAAG